MRSSISASPKSPTVYSRETWLPPAPLPSVSASRFCLRFCLPFLPPVPLPPVPLPPIVVAALNARSRE